MPQLNFRGQPFRETTSLLRVPTATSDASTMAEKSRGTAREIKEPRKTVASGAHWPDENESSTSDSSQSAANAAMVGASLEFTKKKKNTDFHALFRSVPEEEVLIDEFICALQREILVQGKLYVTRSHICFYANIFGWVTQLVIAFTEVVNIEKKMAALLFPSAIQIATLHSKVIGSSWFLAPACARSGTNPFLSISSHRFYREMLHTIG
ncbi:MAG: GRAM domain-containing protein [Olpidium bornovanus]|uniref:GRAM domain-containing protein n=1 Tax=Olpidium bornovanus TaxID=278681 RepID=A0A8H8A0A0_9FUNG|nr:MAG: GRAM domain-containing protein [Olpidium bornovanus]